MMETIKRLKATKEKQMEDLANYKKSLQQIQAIVYYIMKSRLAVANETSCDKNSANQIAPLTTLHDRSKTASMLYSFSNITNYRNIEVAVDTF
jgi:hypothetical protein